MSPPQKMKSKSIWRDFNVVTLLLCGFCFSSQIGLSVAAGLSVDFQKIDVGWGVAQFIFGGLVIGLRCLVALLAGRFSMVVSSFVLIVVLVSVGFLRTSVFHLIYNKVVSNRISDLRMAANEMCVASPYDTHITRGLIVGEEHLRKIFLGKENQLASPHFYYGEILKSGGICQAMTISYRIQTRVWGISFGEPRTNYSLIRIREMKEVSKEVWTFVGSPGD